ncbi:hypothetical protein PR048_029641 [Dryococelus australis]|uniref:Uncharacterized protein n=1 Tax=Dryococelus australis TaxID=614101 RepID=A0ABQ9GE96_9NEOP|nr:hypothetical protein PR048_029641 [Dryococelus australis]
MKGRGETGDPLVNPPTSGIIRYDSQVRESGSDSSLFALVGGELKTRRMSADGTPPSLDVLLVQCHDDKDLVRCVSSRNIWHARPAWRRIGKIREFNYLQAILHSNVYIRASDVCSLAAAPESSQCYFPPDSMALATCFLASLLLAFPPFGTIPGLSSPPSRPVQALEAQSSGPIRGPAVPSWWPPGKKPARPLVTREGRVLENQSSHEATRCQLASFCPSRSADCREVTFNTREIKGTGERRNSHCGRTGRKLGGGGTGEMRGGGRVYVRTGCFDMAGIPHAPPSLPHSTFQGRSSWSEGVGRCSPVLGDSRAGETACLWRQKHKQVAARKMRVHRGLSLRLRNAGGTTPSYVTGSAPPPSTFTPQTGPNLHLFNNLEVDRSRWLRTTNLVYARYQGVSRRIFAPDCIRDVNPCSPRLKRDFFVTRRESKGKAGSMTLLLLPDKGPRWCSGQTTRLSLRRNLFDSRRTRAPIFARGNHAGRCHWSAGLLGDFLFPTLLHIHLVSPSSALKTLMLRTAQPTESLQLHSPLTPTKPSEFLIPLCQCLACTALACSGGLGPLGPGNVVTTATPTPHPNHTRKICVRLPAASPGSPHACLWRPAGCDSLDLRSTSLPADVRDAVCPAE